MAPVLGMPVRMLRRWRLWLFAVRVRCIARAMGSRVTLELARDVRIRGRVHVQVERGCHTTIRVDSGTLLDREVLLVLGGGSIELGPTVQLRKGCVLRLRGGRLRFAGQNVLSYYSTIHCDEAIDVGEQTIIGEHTTIVDSNHVPTADPDDWFIHHVATAPVSIGRRCWIGAKVTVVPGVSIGDDVTVAANAVVTRALSSGARAAGVPARPTS